MISGRVLLGLVLLGMIRTVSPQLFACNVTNINLAFVIHPLYSRSWHDLTSFVADVVDGFRVGPNSVRVALISYGSTGVDVRIPLGQYTDKTTLTRAINNATNIYLREDWQVTPTDALDIVRTQVFPGPGTASVQRYVVVATDDPPVYPDLTALSLLLQAIEKLRDNNGVEVLALTAAYDFVDEYTQAMNLLFTGCRFRPIVVQYLGDLLDKIDTTVATLCTQPADIRSTATTGTVKSSSRIPTSADISAETSTAATDNISPVDRSSAASAELPNWAIAILAAGGGASVVLIVVLAIYLKQRAAGKSPLKVDTETVSAIESTTHSSSTTSDYCSIPSN